MSSKSEPAGEPCLDQVNKSKDNKKTGKAVSQDLKVEDVKRKEIKKLQQEVEILRAKLTREQESQKKAIDEVRDTTLAVARRLKIYTTSLGVLVTVLLISVYNLNRNFELEMINGRKHFNIKLANATLEHDQNTLDLQKKHEAEMSKIIADCQLESAKQQQQYEFKINQQDVLCEQKIKSYVGKLQTLQVKSESDRTSAIDGAKLEHERNTLELQKKHEAEMSKIIADSQLESVKQQKQYESKINQQEVLNEQKIKSFVGKLKTLQVKSESDRTSAIDGAKLEHERSTLELQKKHEAEMSKIIADCQHESVKQQKQYESKINQQDVLCEQKINSYVSELKTLQVKSERERTSAIQKLSELRKDCDANLHKSQMEHREQMTSLRNELSEQRRDCTANLQKSQVHYQEQMTSLRHELDTQQKDCNARVLRCQVMNVQQQSDWDREKETISRQLDEYQDKFERERNRCNDRGLIDNFVAFVGSVFNLFGLRGSKRSSN